MYQGDTLSTQNNIMNGDNIIVWGIVGIGDRMDDDDNNRKCTLTTLTTLTSLTTLIVDVLG